MSQAVIEHVGKLKRKTILSLSWSDLGPAIHSKLRDIQKRTKVPGFRPGKAPIRMVESAHGDRVRDEVLNDAVQHALSEVLKDAQIQIAGGLSFEVLSVQEGDTHIRVAATFEVFPEIVIGDLSTQDVLEVSAEVTDDDIERTIDVLRQQRIPFLPTEDAVATGHRVTIDFDGTVDGQAFAGSKADGYVFVLGANHVLPDFESGIIGMRKGEKRDVTLRFPQNYSNEELADKEAVFAITLRDVSAPGELPELDEAFVKSIGVEDGSIDTMRAEVKRNVVREVNRLARERTKANAFNALLAVTSIELPESLVQREVERLAKEARSKDTTPFEEEARRRVSLGLLMVEIAKTVRLAPQDQQIRAIVSEFSENYENPKEVFDWYMSDQKNLEGAINLAIEDNLTAYILERARVHQQQLTFNEIMGRATIEDDNSDADR